MWRLFEALSRVNPRALRRFETAREGRPTKVPIHETTIVRTMAAWRLLPMWNLPPPPGFQGLRDDKPLHIYQRHLPHWRQDGATYFVTFRLADSLPQMKLRELASFRKEWERLHPPPHPNEELDQLSREIMQCVNRWLDQGFGACVLKEPSLAARLIESLHHFDVPSQGSRIVRRTAREDRQKKAEPGASDGKTAWEDRPTESRPTEGRYELGCYVVMPNHVHAVVRPVDCSLHPLEKIVGGWKQHSASRIQEMIGNKGHLWQDEAFDRIIRDEEHLWHVVQYIGRNPEWANLSYPSYSLWVRQAWESLGWTFESRRTQM